MLIKQGNLGAPFCAVCRAAITNRIGPLATQQARTHTALNVLARFPEHLDVFAVASDGRTVSNWWDQASGWAGWFHVQGESRASRGLVGRAQRALSRFADHIDLFTTGADGRVMSTWWDVRSGWASWFQVANGTASPGSAVTAVARHEHHLDLFVVAADRHIKSRYWHEGSQWANWFDISGGVTNAGGQITALARFAEHIDLFAVGADGIIYSAWWNLSDGWSSWFQLGVS